MAAPKTLKAILLAGFAVALMGGCATAFADDLTKMASAAAPVAASSAPTSPSATAPAQSTVAANSPAATVAAAAPKINRQTFGEWEVECFDPKINGLKCQMVQRLVAKDSKQLVLVVSVAYSETTKKHLMQIALPLNFMLKPGVEINVGGAKTVAQVDRCSAQGCFIEGVAGDDLVAALSKGTTADIKFLANAEKRLVIPFSLTGFAAAYDDMKKQNGSAS